MAETMPTPISSIRNIGPATEAAFAKAGITSAEQIHALGAHEAYRRWLQAGLAPHFIGYYVLHMGLQGRSWNDCKGDEKKALRVMFDALVAETKPSFTSELEKHLDVFGVISKRS